MFYALKTFFGQHYGTRYVLRLFLGWGIPPLYVILSTFCYVYHRTRLAGTIFNVFSMPQKDSHNNLNIYNKEYIKLKANS